MRAKASPLNWLGRDDPSAGGGDDRPVAAGAAQQVDADEIGDVARPGLGGDIGERAGLDDRTTFEDDDAVGECVGVDWIVGDEEADAVEGGEVAA